MMTAAGTSRNALDAAPPSLSWPVQERWVRELACIRRAGASSRTDLHHRLGVRKNTVGDDVAQLVKAGVLSEMEAAAEGNGRPSTPLQIDPESRHVLGVAIRRGRIMAGRVNLLGESIGREVTIRSQEAAELIESGRSMVADMIDESTLAVGLNVPGYVDPEAKEVLFSAAWPGSGHVSLVPLARATGGRPLLIENQTNALALWWLLENAEAAHASHLLIYLSPGRIGATLIVGGRPVPGPLTGSNELGHMRMAVHTPRCYCGQRGCLERVFSTGYLRRMDPASATLRRVVRDSPDRKHVQRMTDLTALGLANAINFTRAGRVTIVADLADADAYLNNLADRVRGLMLCEFRDRVVLDISATDTPGPVRIGAAVALAPLFIESGSRS